MLLVIGAIALVGADSAAIQQQAADAYRNCVAAKATEFRKSDLSGDTPEIAVKAAAIACSGERAALIEATKAFLSERHPDLTPGSLGKVGALFIETQDRQVVESLGAHQAEH
jgi:hypothetical protein